MKILGMGWPELIIILVVVLLIFGPKNLPKLGAAFGKTVKNLKEGLGSKDKGAAAPEQEAVEVAEVEPEAAPEIAAAEVAPEPAPEPAPVEQAAPKRVVKTVVKKKPE